MLDEHEQKIIKLINRRLLSPQAIVLQLLRATRLEHENGALILDALNPDLLEPVFRCLEEYPTSDFGWSLLPKSRTEYDVDSLTKEEMGDLSKVPFQEDKPLIEALLKTARAKLS